MGVTIGGHNMWQHGESFHPQDGQAVARPDMTGGGAEAAGSTLGGNEHLVSGIDNTTHPGMTTYTGPDAEVSAPRKGVSVQNSFQGTSSNPNPERIRDNVTGEIIDRNEMLKRQSSADNSDRYYGADGNGRTRSQLRQQFKGNEFTPEVDQSVVAKTGESVPIGGTLAGNSTADRVGFSPNAQNLIAKEGTYDQMGDAAKGIVGANRTVSPALQSGITEGNKLQENEKGTLANPPLR